MTRWIRSASQLTRLSTVGIWLLLRVERLQGGREVLERGLGEKLCWLTVRAPAVKTGSPPPGRGEEGDRARKKGWGRAMSLLFLPPMPLRHPARVKCIWKWMRAGRCSGDCCGFAGVSQEPQALSKGSSDAVMYVLATCGVREQPQERRGTRGSR